MEHTHTILIVEDDDALRRMLEQSLNDEGYRVVTAAHGAAALQILDKATPTLLLLDVELPWVNGLEVLSTIRGIPRLRDVPVLIASGTPIAMRDVQLHRPIAIIHKPFSVDVLIVTVRKLLRAAAPEKRRTASKNRGRL